MNVDLAYYEVQDIIAKSKKSKKRAINVIHDKEAAVKYFSFDKDQWISYDDAETFKQKVDWANEAGFSGSLIWASDLGMHLLEHTVEPLLTMNTAQTTMTSLHMGLFSARTQHSSRPT